VSARTGSRGGRPTRRLLLLIVVVVAALAVVTAALTGGPAARTDAQPDDTPSVIVGKVSRGAAGPTFDRRLTFLVIGSDSGAPRFGRGGLASRGRADSIHLVVVDPRTRKGTVVGFPRDSWVPIPGRGSGRINSAMVFGGPELLVRTVEALSGIQVHYWVLTSFDGLTDLVDGVGGVRVRVRLRIDDRVAGANLRPGVKRLGGAQALAYSRARKTIPGGDLARSRHQADVLLGGLGTFQAQMRRDPAALMRWLAVVRREVATDLTFGELLRLALVARQIPPGGLSNKVLPGSGASVGGASVIRLGGSARRILADTRAGRY
jgi:polyisoprenyl-teichoic acid--peptidoglycan teichoic acid transferase